MCCSMHIYVAYIPRCLGMSSLLHYNCGCYTKEGNHDTYKAGSRFQFANVFRLILCKACYKNN